MTPNETKKAIVVGILYCPEEGCSHILAVGGPAIDGSGLAHSYKKGNRMIKHEGFKKAVLTVERDPVEHEDVDDWHKFLQKILDELIPALEAKAKAAAEAEAAAQAKAETPPDAKPEPSDEDE